jgi:hypothetical protein
VWLEVNSAEARYLVPPTGTLHTCPGGWCQGRAGPDLDRQDKRGRPQAVGQHPFVGERARAQMEQIKQAKDSKQTICEETTNDKR